MLNTYSYVTPENTSIIIPPILQITYNPSKSSIPKIDNIFKYELAYGPYVYVRDRIKLERRKELAGERERYFDLLRYGTAGDVLPEAYKAEVAQSKQYLNFIKGVHELLPIPQIEIELSHGIITQNSGY